MQRHLDQVDRKTGEILEGVVVYIAHRPKVKERWMMSFQDGIIEIAKDLNTNKEMLRVFLYLYGSLDFENFIYQTQKSIAEELGMQRSHVSRAFKLLREKQIILESPKIGNARCYRLNPNYGWKGKVKNLEEVRREQFKVIEGGKPNE
jgi:DNA-binding MarR family transcriptional regulator